LLLELDRCVLCLLLLGDRPAHVGCRALSFGKLAARDGGPADVRHGSGRDRATVVDGAEPEGDPVAEVMSRLGGQLMPPWLPLGHGGSTGLGQQVAPGAVEELVGDDVVAVSLGHEDGEVGEPTCLGGEAGVEGQRAVEDRGPGEA
jgi:hypothetical protein